MRITDLLDVRSISLNAAPADKSQTLDAAVSLMTRSGKINDEEAYRKQVYAREEESTTGIGEGIAIPHGKCDAVEKPGLAAMVIPGGVAVVMALIGLYLLCITDGFSIGKGDFLVLICAFLFSLHILVIDYFSPKTDGVKMSCIQFLVCGILTAIPAIILEHPSLSSFSGAWGATLYAGVMSCGVAYTLQIVGQKNMNPTVASLILSLESCISVLAGWIILGQKLSTREIIGCVVMFGAIVLAQLPQKETASEK